MIAIIINFSKRHYLYFWKFESNEKVVYLLGTLHAFKQELHHKIDPQIIDAFYNSDLIVIERMDRTSEGWFYPSGHTLKNSISEEHYMELREMLSNNGICIEEYHHYKPIIFAKMMLRISSVRYGYDEYFQNGIDLYFYDKCHGRDVKLDALEYEIYSAVFLEEELSEYELGYYLLWNIYSSLEKGNFIKETSEFLMQCWLEGTVEKYIDETGIWIRDRVLEEENEVKNNMFEALKTVHKRRNFQMADRIEEFIRSDETYTIFIMAGGGHFVGESSIIDILQDRGYKIKRYKRSIALPFL